MVVAAHKLHSAADYIFKSIAFHVKLETIDFILSASYIKGDLAMLYMVV